jgi:CBS domain containing-hemolysin-like protein
MSVVLIGVLLAALVLVSISLQRAYSHLPLKELKRRAREQDQTAMMLHRAAAYGTSLQAVLWVLVGLSAAGFFVFTTLHTSGWTAFIISAGLVWSGFAWLSNKEVKALGLWFASLLAPAFAWVLQYLHPAISWIGEQIHNYYPVQIHTGLYDKEDLLELLNHQNVQADNRIEEQELALAFYALTFGDKLVSDHMTPRRMVKEISIDDQTGPVLMDELHGSGFSRFPVYEGKKDHIVGTLFLRDLVKVKDSSKVRSVMRPDVYYVHEDQSLYDALAAILKTRHHLLIVVNSFEEYVGVISIEDVLEEIVGRPILDEFDRYDDLRAVAERAATKEHKTHKEAPSSEKA